MAFWINITCLFFTLDRQDFISGSMIFLVKASSMKKTKNSCKYILFCPHVHIFFTNFWYNTCFFCFSFWIFHILKNFPNAFPNFWNFLWYRLIFSFFSFFIWNFWLIFHANPEIAKNTIQEPLTSLKPYL